MKPPLPVRGHTAFLFVFSLTIPPFTASPPAQQPSEKLQTSDDSDAFVFDTVGDASLLKLLGGSGQDVHSDAESDDAPACKNSSSDVSRVVVEPITFEVRGTV
jgi:hypothetical protein